MDLECPARGLIKPWMALWYFLLLTSLSDKKQMRHTLGAWELSTALTKQQFWPEM